MAETTHTEWRRGQFREQRDHFFTLLFNSSALYYLQTPTRRYGHASTPSHFLPISGDRDVSLPLSLEWPVWSSSSGNNCHAVHRPLSSGASLWSGTFTLSHIISRAHLRDFFRLLTIEMCHFRYLRNGRCDHHRAEIIILQFIGHSLPVHHFFLRHSENFFYLVSYCEPSCILQGDHFNFQFKDCSANRTPFSNTMGNPPTANCWPCWEGSYPSTGVQLPYSTAHHHHQYKSVLIALIPMTVSRYPSLLAIAFGKSSTIHTELMNVSHCWYVHR